MVHHSSIAACVGGTVLAGRMLEFAEALWIEPYRTVAVAAWDDISFQVYASFDGVNYFTYGNPISLTTAVIHSWNQPIPARYLKLVNDALGDDVYELYWGAKS